MSPLLAGAAHGAGAGLRIIGPVETRSGERPAAAAARFEAIYERHAAEMLRYALRCTGRREVAEELASEAFLRLYQNLDSIDAARAGAWLSTAVKNLATDYWRRQALERRQDTASIGWAFSRGGGEASAPEAMECRSLLDHGSLKPEHRVCLMLHYVHGLANREITSYTGFTENQVKSAIQYGLKLLRKAVRESEGDEVKR